MAMFPLKQPQPKPELKAEPTGDVEFDEYERVVAHRTLNLIDLGFSMQQVIQMGVGRQGFDWHEADRLLKQGSTHEQATWLLED